MLTCLFRSDASHDIRVTKIQPKRLLIASQLGKSLLIYRPTSRKINFFSTPGHEPIELNEKADEAAKKAAEEQEDRLILNTSLALPKKIADSLASLEKGNEAIQSQRHRPLPKMESSGDDNAFLATPQEFQ
ncbi:hypothetical protein CROQUDRAFT_103704 [Cronartium quercuum f. sp. fusiforme G11]|uniref:Uncharacterized protein n=1 Tax=Cronartium quercuum f. sp. fusiforme G11 TaxID=708437 RepID=A0A9P6TGG0_9BASI|nr:hypothetical protein CROQUDRAFT_103704 [Cronartium quercuum f. sp. fusiforme G11]